MRPPIDDYPPLVPDNADADALFSELGISAKPTFTKPAAKPRASLLGLSSGDEESGAAWGGSGDDDLDDI